MQRCLVIQTAFFGDVILATALVEQWASKFPECEIDMLVHKGKEALLANHVHLNQVYTFDKSRKYLELIRLIPKIRSRQYDIVINVHRHGTSGILAGLSGSPIRVGFKVHPLSWMFSHKVHHQREGRHEVDRNYELIRPWVGETDIRRPAVYPSDQDFARVRRDAPYVTMSPASVWYTKQWPAERWVALIDAVPASHDVLLLGGPDDRALAEKIAKQVDRAIEICCGDFTFLQSAALMKGAQMNFANDSAPIHLASAMNAPMRAIFCSTIPAFGYGPLSDDSLIIESDHTLACRPCGIHGHRQCPKGHFKCADIGVTKVIAGIVW